MMLKDKVALVTGGTSGIGRATAIAFGAAGAKVVFSGRRDAEGETTSAMIRETGAECLFVRSDVSDEAEVQALVDKTIATYGRLDCAFNNAGIEPPLKPLHKQSIEDFDKLMSINVRGLFLCMRYEIQQMLNQGSGVIINNSSMGGLIAFPGISPYIASKHAVMGLTRSAALDYAKQGIRINAVNPGLIATAMMDRLSSGSTDDVGSTVPMGRMGQAAEIAQAVVFLCSDAASYITGQPFAIDGGYTAS
ncbi:MAG: 2,5-dichloro-2,5-cyclohexadiene-1,4-diol dehydrogenase [Chroococcidiopsis cubana SAG 39.79]|uniref:Short chain dehydrogenase n=1 Tax=Chroococcidiopsis cubana SAG 39.79 TaxID=388085 RepID=A0AB37UAP3_9CYAN|nr:SDR family oxidoreductase [Chroococcidiopsis cubana]MDZ4870721.1 2,5-dichloro-2,5-cyclohexadiene-1,4-diol dehydrogenase [Chroococcidiopsis cubana SAG 39.79]PSB60886.1 short chain dehydrogenase [Chroococcidiopsis cubana CCALA 043]RUT03306.1 short chain dehydrogenase [Chroococcidiopsis cubana SAG 39.79]